MSTKYTAGQRLPTPLQSLEAFWQWHSDYKKQHGREPTRTESARAAALASMDDAAVERACRAHWPSFDRMRPDHQRKWRAKMAQALSAAAIAS